MSDNKKYQKTLMLKGDSFRIALFLRATTLRFAKENQDLVDEFNRRQDALREKMNLTLLSGWEKLSALESLPIKELVTWHLDATYAEEHGCAFLNKPFPEEEGEEQKEPEPYAPPAPKHLH